jgi:hypothetical protein
MENKPMGQVTGRECGLFDEHNRLVRTIFWLCSASVSKKSTDKLTDTTKLDGEHKKIIVRNPLCFSSFFC